MSQITKTYTCSHCGKVGTDFSTMAKDPCPVNGPAGGHQIPIFGDSVKNEVPEIVRPTPRMSQEQIDEMNRDYARREALMAEPVKVGDIFERSWGYEQTNVDFYKVIEITKSGKSTKLIKIGQKVAKVTGDMSETVIADPDHIVGEETRTLRIRQSTPTSHVYIGYTWRWDGHPCHQSHYA